MAIKYETYHSWFRYSPFPVSACRIRLYVRKMHSVLFGSTANWKYNTTQYNKPNFIACEHKDKTCKIMIRLIRLYPNHDFSTILILFGATGLVTNSIQNNLNEMGFNDQVAKRLSPNFNKRFSSST